MSVTFYLYKVRNDLIYLGSEYSQLTKKERLQLNQETNECDKNIYKYKEKY